MPVLNGKSILSSWVVHFFFSAVERLLCCVTVTFDQTKQRKSFMAVTCTHFYSFVSIETLSSGQACV